jgi:prophage regulatory protein
MRDRIHRLPAVIDYTGTSRSTIYARITAGLWPRPIALGTRMVGWPESEIDALIAARIRGDGEDAIRALVARLESDRKKVA